MEAKARDNYLDLAKRLENDELVKMCHEMADEEQEHFDLLTEARVGTDTPDEDRPAL
jgi:rubrerythrin